MHRFGLLALLIFLLFPTFAYAALININTADKVTLMSLEGIGDTLASRIIAFREAHGPFKTIEELVPNIERLYQSEFDKIKNYITVGETSVPDTTASSTPDVATTTPANSGSSGSGDTYTPPPSSIAVKINGAQKAFMEVPMILSAHATTKSGAVDSAAQISWSFGDGSSLIGSEVTKVYRYAGTYVVTAIATDGTARARDEIIITVKPAKVHILSVVGDGITIANDSDERLDLSLWRLISSTGTFRIPEGMTILPGTTALLPYTITNLPVSFDATLLYPNGIVATRYIPPAATIPVETLASDPIQISQPSATSESSNQVQTVEQIISPKTSVELYENKAVIAPATTPDTGGVAGAAIPAPALAAVVTASPSPQKPVTGLFHSVWSLGLLGIMTLAGGAFILL